MLVLVFGAGGQLGSDVVSVLTDLGHSVVGLLHADVDITDIKSVFRVVKKFTPDVVINAAAYTDVDGCESRKDLAFLVNAVGARNVAVASCEVGSKIVHISTDYVFDGRKEAPYNEFDEERPLNVYGASKLAGERFVREHGRRFFILRVAWLYGARGRNFVKTMVSMARDGVTLRVVNDQWGTPTWSRDVAFQIERLIHTDCYGIYHCTSQGFCTWFEFAREIFRLMDMDVDLVPIETSQFPRPARRPRWSVLDNYMLRIQSLDTMPHWKDSLKEFIATHREVLV